LYTDNKSAIRGCAAEMLVALKFTNEGYIASFPLRPCGYDLVVDTGGELFRVQVKQAQWEKARTARPGGVEAQTVAGLSATEQALLRRLLMQVSANLA